MQYERYQILSLANLGQLEPEEVELRLAQLGKRERAVFRVLLSSGTLVTVTALVFCLNLTEAIRYMWLTASMAGEAYGFFQDAYNFCRQAVHIF